MRQPKRVTVRSTYEYSTNVPTGFTVFVYHRKVEVQLHFPQHYNRPLAVLECIRLWHATINEVA